MMNFKKIKKILFLSVLLPECLFNVNISQAEFGYNFTTKEFINGNQDKSDNDEKEEKDKTGNNATNQIKLKIGGMSDFQYTYDGQPSVYNQEIMPNGLKNSPAMMTNYSILNGDNSNMYMAGKIDINPEFVRYKPKDKQEQGKDNSILKAGVKITQPFQNASKTTNPSLMSQEYIYIDTKFFRFEFGSVASSVAKMRVDPSSLASGKGGVYGTWWRYIQLPVFDVSGLSAQNAMALNAMSPVFILYPVLPNEAGFTTQLFSVGRSLNSNMFTGGNVSAENLMFGSRGQGYPTHGANSNKLSLYTKRFYGFRFGFSYSPSTSKTGYITKEINGDTKAFANMAGGDVRDYMSFALDYRKQIDKYGLGFALFIGYEMGKASDLRYNYNAADGTYNSVAVSSNTPYYNRNNLSAVAVGGKLVWKNFSIAYSYGYWGNSLLNKYQQTTNGEYQVVNQKNTSYYHTVGIGANYGPVRIGMTYMRSSMAGNTLDAWSIGTDYKMISLKYLRVNPYLEYVGYHFHNLKHELIAGSGIFYKTIGNNGYVLTAGIRVIF